MLKNYLTVFPPTKFVIIEDTVNERGDHFVEYLLNNHSDKQQTNIHYFVFQEPFFRVKARLAHRRVNLYDYVSNPLGWNSEEKKDFENVIKRVCDVNGAIFIDSLAHVIYSLGLGETYALFNALRKLGIQQQLVTVLHRDLLDVNVNASQIFRNLSTLSMNLLPKFDKQNNRVEYVYIKPGGKVFKEIEEYCFQKGNLVTKKIEKLDPKKLVSSQLDPELLATFKIGLSIEEKQIRDERRGEILPYLPKSDEPNEAPTGRITYKFDETDDWDEEDPDDDLDI